MCWLRAGRGGRARHQLQHLLAHGEIELGRHADLLAEQCRSFGANLLVMGSYGHSAQHDLLPGSTTSRMLRISPVPLLIAH